MKLKLGLSNSIRTSSPGVSRGVSSSTYHLNFDGVDDKITILHAASINNLPAGDFTVDFVGGNWTHDGYICSKTAANFEGWELYLSTGSGTRLTLYVTYDDYAAYVIFNALVDGSALHHYEITWKSSTNTPKIFIDGIVASDTIDSSSGPPYNTYDSDSANDLYTGLHYSGNYPLDLRLNWLRISNTVRHTSSFTPPSLTVAPSADANTKLLLALDTGSGTTATDTSGNNNNGTISGATWEAD